MLTVNRAVIAGVRRGFSKTTSRARRAFTLVELLVVITIIGMLMALLLPAIQSAREAGRRNTCSNNMRNVTQALISVEASNRGFPGYANEINGKRASWVVPILTNLERADMYRVWKTQAPGAIPAADLSASSPWSHSLLNILLCPSSPIDTLGTNPLSFVVNCGSAFTASDNAPGGSADWAEDRNSGIFFNQAAADWNGENYNPVATAFGTGTANPGDAPGPKVTIDFISTNDGTSNTLMVSENLQCSNWATDPFINETPWVSEFQIKQNMGMVFFITQQVTSPGNIANNDPNLSSTVYNPLSAGINGLAIGGPTRIDKGEYNAMSAPTAGLAYSRPSSAHPGGVNAFFVDNHYRFLNEEMEYRTYTQLMTPRQNNLVLNVSGNTPLNPPAGQVWNYILNEQDY